MASPIVQIKRNDSITALSSHIGLLPGELAFDYGNGILYIGAGTSSSTSDCIPINPINTVTLNAGAGLTGGGSYTNGHGIDATLSFALATSGVTAGSYGPSANATPGYGVTFNVPYITVDKYGRVTGASTKTVKIPASDNTNTSHTHTAGTGLTISGVGGTSGTTTYSVNLNSTTSLGVIGTTSKLYAIGVDDNGQLCVNIPWSNTTYSVAKYNTLGLVKPAYTTTGAATLTTAAASNTATPTIQAKTTNSDRYYAVEADKNGYLFVNVPWANTNTDTKVTQTVTTSNSSYPLLLAPSGQTATTTTTSYFDSGVTLNPSTNTITANISGTAARATHADNGVYYVEGDTGGTAGTWTGTNTNIPSLYTGLTIAYKIGTAGHADGTTLNLTIANNTTTGNITVYRNTGNTTTHLPVNSVVILTYDGTGWRWSDYDANSYAYVRQYSTSTNANYPLLFRYQVAAVSSGSYETKYVRFDSDSAIYANPSTGLLAATSFSGSGASLTNLNASNLSSGTVPVARLPVAAATTVGVVQGFHHTTGTATGTRTTNATNAPAINSRTTTENRYYGIETDSIGKMYVNVPWANTTYTFENKGVTLAWGQTSTIATVGGTNITLTMPANPDTNTTYGVAKYNTLGLVKPAYTSTNSATLTTAAATNTTTPTIAAKTTTSGRYYAIEADKNGYMFVNVPWVNTDTTYSAGTGLSLSGTTFNHSNSITAKTTYNQATASPGYGGTFKITEPKYDAQGHITGVQVATITMPSAQTIPTSLKNPYPLKAGTKSYDGSQAVEITAADLGLSSAMKFLGTSATAITDGATTNPITIGSTSTTVTNGNVVLYGSKEFVWTGSAWEELGNEGSYKIVQTAVSSPTASGNATAFIDTISQDTNGKITVTKKNVSFPNLSGGTAAAADAKVIGGVTVNGHAITAAQKTIKGAGSVTVSGTASEITITGVNTTYEVAKYNTLGLVKPAYSSTGAATLTTTAATNTSTPTIAAKTTTADRYYAVEIDKNGVLFVNVPWVNTDTTYSLSDLGGVGTVSASGTAPLSLSASKSGTTVTLTGSVATAGAASLGVVQGWHRTSGTATGTRVTNASNAPAIAARTTTSGRYYGVETDASGRMFVNVPWTDTNTDTNTAFPYLSGWADTRNVATKPNDYNAKLSVVGIKTPTASGITSTDGGSYSTLVGIRGWSDSSGGNSHELAFCGNGALYHRHGSTTDWNAWDRLLTASEAIPYIEGPDTDEVGVWTGTYFGISAYTNGLTIIYVPGVAGINNSSGVDTTLNINGLGDIPCYYTNSTQLTTNYTVGTPILLTYTNGMWKRADYDSNTNTQIRVYRQTSGYNSDYPILVSRTATSSIGTSGTNSSYSAVYGVIGNNGTKTPTINPHTGVIKAPGGFTGNLTGNASTASKLGTSTVGGTCQPIYLSSGTATAGTSYAGAIKSITRSGTTFTYTCIDGTTGTFTQQDNNTTYSADRGISLVSGKFGHSNTAITAGSVGTAQTPSHGGTFAIPKITYDAYGHITGATTVNITLPADNNTDTKVTQNSSSANSNLPLLLAYQASPTSGTASTTNYDTSIYANPSTNSIGATNFLQNGLDLKRIYCSMIPYGTAIPADADLNTTTYLKVGNYYCSANATVATLTNCPTSSAFMMQVYTPLSTTIDNEATGTWVYRLRKMLVYTGIEYIQYVYSGSTAGTFTYGPWKLIIKDSDTATASTAGVVKVSSVNTTAVTVNSETTTAGRYYPVEMNSDGKLIVNVPWATYSLSGLGGIGSVSASGTAPLNLSASKSGTAVTITGSLTTPTSGSWFNSGVVRVGGDGVAEYGRYIDFHYTSASTNDYDVRIDCAGNSKNILYLPAVTGQVVVHTNDTAIGSVTKPVYIAASGAATACTTYAGGTAVTLNNSSKAGSTASFYAPTAGGTANHVLIGQGTTSAPTWTAQSNLSVGSATKDGSGNIITSTYLKLSGGNMSGHVYLTGSKASSSTGNTSQIVFGTSSTQHIALSANDNALVINPTTSSTTNQIVLYLNQSSLFPNGITGNLTGNASTATKFASAQSVALTGDVTGSASSQAGWSIATTLANSGVTAGSYGPSANASPAHGNTFSVPYLTVDAKGRVTAASTKTITLPSIPTIGNATITLTAGNGLTTGGSFTTNATSNKTITFAVGAGSGITVTADAVSVNTSYTTNGRNYKVAVDSTTGGLYVNVPWTDTNTKVTTAAQTSSTIYVTGCTGATTNTLQYNSAVKITGNVLYGAAWNDYAEYRISEEKRPGRVIIEIGDGSLKLSSERLQPGANIVSDTYGFAIGQTKNCQTPIAVSGRVLAYPYEDRNSYAPGDAVCTGPNGTVSKMTREEIREYPERIVGTVSEIPEYDTWGTGNVPVNGRIWIKVK